MENDFDDGTLFSLLACPHCTIPARIMITDGGIDQGDGTISYVCKISRHSLIVWSIWHDFTADCFEDGLELLFSLKTHTPHNGDWFSCICTAIKSDIQSEIEISPCRIHNIHWIVVACLPCSHFPTVVFHQHKDYNNHSWNKSNSGFILYTYSLLRKVEWLYGLFSWQWCFLTIFIKIKLSKGMDRMNYFQMQYCIYKCLTVCLIWWLHFITPYKYKSLIFLWWYCTHPQ